MIIKVCGMREEENIREVAALDVNWLGFIFYPKSPRATDGQPLLRTDLLDKRQKRVGVFVNVSVEAMMEKANLYHLDYLQLHGNESPEDCHTLRKRGYSLIKAFSIASATDLERTQPYEGRVDYFLFDTKCEGYGGSGRQFDWSFLASYTGDTSFLLSGGIQPANADAILAFRHPRWAGIDLNSGFEVCPGRKDVEKLKLFIKQIKR